MFLPGCTFLLQGCLAPRALWRSRHLTQAEAGYVALEGEALAVSWCLHKVRLFLLGCPNLTIVTDHRPLVKVLGYRVLTDVSNPRLYRLKERTLQYNFQVKYLPWKKNSAADLMSRYSTLFFLLLLCTKDTGQGQQKSNKKKCPLKCQSHKRVKAVVKNWFLCMFLCIQYFVKFYE